MDDLGILLRFSLFSVISFLFSSRKYCGISKYSWNTCSFKLLFYTSQGMIFMFLVMLLCA